MVTPAVRREAVAQVRVAFEVSERRACSALGVDRALVRYRSRRPDDANLRARLRELAGQRRRFGYRRLHILMIWEGLVMNHKKLRRLYREEGLQVRRRGGRKRKLSDYQRAEAIKHRGAGETLAQIAKSYGVDISMISRL
jgi:putative transposase